MFRILLSLFFLLPFLLQAELAEPYNLTTTVKSGEGLHAVLRRYAINNACNSDEFFRLNGMKKSDILIEGKEYKLPITIYDYDGKSIRSSILLNEWERAVKIKEYNEYIQSKGIRQTHYAESKILWVPYHLIACFTLSEVTNSKNEMTTETSVNEIVQKKNTAQEIIKEEIKYGNPNSEFEYEKLFGSTYEKMEIVDRSLKNKVVYIVSGHGGPDPGAMCTTCPSTLCEDEYAYDVALRLARNLRQHGAIVEMIIQDNNDGIRDEKYLKCDKDERCGNQELPINQKKRLYQRAERMNVLYQKYKSQGYSDHIAIVLHIDAAGSGHRKDVFFYHHENSSKGKQTAYNIHKTFEKKYDKFQKGRGYKGTIKSRGLYIINHTNPPVVFIELANIKNPDDQQRILLSSNRQALANWLFEGIIMK